MPEDRLRRSMLLDYYGELLTQRQRECYELHYNEDLSLSEIAEQCGISRQGAWDNIRRADEALEKLEDLPLDPAGINLQNLEEGTNVITIKVQKPSEDAVLSNDTVIVTVDVEKDE